MNDPSELVWLDNIDFGNYNKFYWSNLLTGIRFRDQVTGDVTYE